VKQQVMSLRQKHLDMRFCFSRTEMDGLFEELHHLAGI
jgi:hypothetical protein